MSDRLNRYYTGPWQIYALIDPRNDLVRYVGCSKHVNIRVAQFIMRKGNIPNKKLLDWLDELEVLNLFPSWKVLESGEGLKWSEAERRHIKLYREVSDELLNISAGGPGAAKSNKDLDRSPQREGIKRYWDGRQHVGRPRSEEARKSTSEAMKRARAKRGSKWKLE